MNIVILNDSCEVDGGAAKIAIEDARQLALRGHRVIFFSASGRPPQESGGVEWRSMGQHSILENPNRAQAALMGLWNYPAAAALKKLLVELSPATTVIHLHSWSKALSGSVVAMARQQGFRIVCTLHDYFVACPNGGLYDYPTQQICALRPMSVACVTRNCDSRARVHKVWRVVRQWIWHYLAGIPSAFDRMIAVSNFSKLKMQQSLDGDSAVEVIDNLPTIEQHPLQTLEQRQGVIYIGRVAAEKGVDLYLQACRLAQVQAEVCGDGPLLPQLKKAWPQALFSGWIPSEKLQARLRSAEIIVVPSRWYETYGLVVAEAAAAGVPVIVSDHGAAADLVDDGVTGLHFKSGDAEDLARKIAVLRADPDRAYAMGAAAFKRFWDNYKDRKAQRMIKFENCYAMTLAGSA